MFSDSDEVRDVEEKLSKDDFLLDDVGRHVTLDTASSDPVPVL